MGRTTLKLVSNQTFGDHNICMKNSFLERKWRAGFSLKAMKKASHLSLSFAKTTDLNDRVLRTTLERAELTLVSAL